jgi:uncharacterized membrane protein YhaH (DUF805 family)
MDLPQLLFSFSGRLNRQPYWLISLGLGFACAAVFTIASMILPDILVSVGAIGVVIAYFWIALAVSIKRTHDRGRSALFLLLALIPVLNLWPLIELGFLRGTAGTTPTGPTL